MIRLFVLIGTIGGLAIAYFSIFAVGPIAQRPPSESLLSGFRAQGFIPASVNLEEDETAEEAEVFEIPPQDAVMLEQILAGTVAMPGMDMPGMEMDGDGEMEMPMADDGKTMDMSGMDMSAMKMPMADDDEAKHMGGSGILIAHGGDFDREIKLTMAEWKFSKMQIDAKLGERIKFTVTNGGQIPHEFMFMDMAQMSTINYRINRADWNLEQTPLKFGHIQHG